MASRLSPLSAASLALLTKERELEPADDALRQRLLERARAALEDRPSGVALRVASANQTARASRLPRTVLLAAAAVAIAGLAVAGAKIYVFGAPPARRVELSLPSKAPQPPVPVARDTAVTLEPPVPAPAPSEPHHTLPAAGEPARAASASTYALELGLLEPARSSIARGDFAGALSAIGRHQHEYPRGQLAEEREALRVRALWGMGQKAQAESLAATFRKRYPRSGLLSWMTGTKSQ
jgi:hypothetical protein